MGTLDFGRIVWAQVNPNISIKVGDDETKVYITATTSHDGSGAFECYETGTRMVCRNTFRLGSLKRLAATLRVKHTKNAQQRISGLKQEIEEIRNVALTMQDRLTWLTRKRVTKESLKTVVDRLFPPKKDENEQDVSSTRRENILSDILTLYEANDGGQFPEQAGTPYALFNAVTNYTDHIRSTKSDMRAQSALFGSGNKLKGDALSIIMEEAERMPDMLSRNYDRVASGPNAVELGLLKS
jgi:phage/plasmid-like protein (TIGR03299 family)